MLVADPHSPDFNTYAGVIDLRAFAAGRGYTVPTDDAECDQMLMQAMDYLEGKSWRGQRSVASQPLSWPRSGVRFDGVDLPDDAIPQRLVDAQCRLAIESQEIDLMPSVAGGGAVTMERVEGAVTVQYEVGTNKAAPSFPWFYSRCAGWWSAAIRSVSKGADMAISYLRMRATATRLLTENGKAYQLTRGGSTIRDQFGKEVTTPAVTATVTGVITEYSSREIDGSLIATGDKKLAATAETEVRIDDRIEIDGKAWRVVQPNPVKPADVLISYNIQLRA